MSRQTKPLGQPAVDIECDNLIDQTIEFIRDSLYPWKNDPDRQQVKAEKKLNGKLADFLSSKAATLFPMVFFRHEQDQGEQRSVDLAAKPNQPVVIHGVRHSIYQPVIVIECKRLPAPSNDREREYVTGENGAITGGIQRFKLGAHGAEHDTAVIVGYVQENSPQDWHPIINGWISDLSESNSEAWSSDEKLGAFTTYNSGALLESTSTHPRVKECKSPRIKIHHFWIQMKTRNP